MVKKLLLGFVFGVLLLSLVSAGFVVFGPTSFSLNITYPLDNYYYSTSINHLDWTFSSGSAVIHGCSYSFDNGATFALVSCSAGTNAFEGLSDANYHLDFYVNYSIGASGPFNVPSASLDFRVDTTPPNLSLNGDNPLTLEVFSSYAEAGASAADNLDGDLTADISINSSEVNTNVLGDYIVYYSVTDSTGNNASATREVHVVDTTPPVVGVPGGITMEATGANGSVVEFEANASDNYDEEVWVSCNYNSGETFAIGNTTVMCNSTDSNGNTGYGSFDVIIRDTTPPVLSLPADMTVEATGPDGANVTFEANATDTVNGDIEVVCTPASGSTFALDPLESTTAVKDVMCTATDNSGNSITRGFNVNVVDTTPPVITLIGDSAVSLTVGDVYTDAGATAEDVVDGNLTDKIAVNSSVNTLVAGRYNVSYDVMDSHGNAAVQVVRNVNVVSVPAPRGIESSGGSGGGSVCYSDWNCTAWSECAAGNQTRTCLLARTNCIHPAKPSESQSCSVGGSAQEPAVPTTETTTGKDGVGGLGGITGAVIGALGNGWFLASVFIAGVFGVAVFLRLRRVKLEGEPIKITPDGFKD